MTTITYKTIEMATAAILPITAKLKAKTPLPLPPLPRNAQGSIHTKAML
jgi:hypothetical protein